jgi:hypothetical protein
VASETVQSQPLESQRLSYLSAPEEQKRAVLHGLLFYATQVRVHWQHNSDCSRFLEVLAPRTNYENDESLSEFLIEFAMFSVTLSLSFPSNRCPAIAYISRNTVCLLRSGMHFEVRTTLHRLIILLTPTHWPISGGRRTSLFLLVKVFPT